MAVNHTDRIRKGNKRDKLLAFDLTGNETLQELITKLKSGAYADISNNNSTGSDAGATVIGHAINKPTFDKLLSAEGISEGTASALTLPQTGFILQDGAKVRFRLHVAMAADATLNVGNSGVKNILTPNGERVKEGLQAGAWVEAIYSSATGAYYLQTIGGHVESGQRVWLYTSSANWTAPADSWYFIRVQGAGGGCPVTTNVFISGGGGGYGEKTIYIKKNTVISVTASATGSSSFGGYITATAGSTLNFTDNNSAGPLVPGGTCTGGDLNLNGGPGQNFYPAYTAHLTIQTPWHRRGGFSVLGTPGMFQNTCTGNPPIVSAEPSGYGGGACGGHYSYSPVAKNGGPGCVIIRRI